MQAPNVSKQQELKLREDAAQYLAKWRDEKVVAFYILNRELAGKVKKKTGFTSKKTKEPIHVACALAVGCYRLWLAQIGSESGNQKQEEVMDIHYLDLLSITCDDANGRVELALNPDVARLRKQTELEPIILLINPVQPLVSSIQFQYHEIAGTTPLMIIGKQIPVTNPFFPDSSTSLFLRMYKSYCNYYGIESDILVPSLLKQFRLRGNTELEIPVMPGASAYQDAAASPIGPYIRALQYDTYFTSLVMYSQVNRKETLDEVAKVVRYNKNLLKIVLTDIDSDNHQAFSEISLAFLHNSSASRLQILNMSNNNVGKHFDNIVKAIANIPTLTFLAFSRCKIPSSCISDLFKLLMHNEKAVQCLKYLDLSYNLSWDNETHSSAASFFKVYSPTKLKLEVLKLAAVGLNMNLLLELRPMGTLRELDISSNYINTTAQIQALEAFLDGASSLSILNLSKCDFGGQQLVTQRDGVNLMKTLFQKSPGIKDIEISFSENANFHSSLSEVLGVASAKLTSLNLSNSRMKDVTLIDIIKLVIRLPNIHTFNIENGSEEQPAGLDVGQYLEEIPSSRSLTNLNCATGYGKECTVLLLQGLKKYPNHSIVKLDISNNLIGNRGALAIAELFLTDTKIRCLACDNNNMSYNAWNSIYVALKGNSKCALRQLMWPSYDVHKVMVEQVELSKKQDFLFLMNQVQARLLLHSSKKPICPENGFISGSRGYDKEIPPAPLGPELPLARPDDNPFEMEAKEDTNKADSTAGKLDIEKTDLLPRLQKRANVGKAKQVYRPTKNHSNGVPFPVFTNPGSYKEDKSGAKKPLPAPTLYNPFLILGSRMIPNEEDFYLTDGDIV